MIFADAGARVVKVEPPEGDRLRTRRPSGFRVWNRGKESLVADLRTPEGQQALREYAARADVMLSAFASQRAEGWGVGGDALCDLNTASRSLWDNRLRSERRLLTDQGIRLADPSQGRIVRSRVIRTP